MTCRLAQHSPMLGQCADSQTVWSPRRRNDALISAKTSGAQALALSQKGVDELDILWPFSKFWILDSEFYNLCGSLKG